MIRLAEALEHVIDDLRPRYIPDEPPEESPGDLLSSALTVLERDDLTPRERVCAAVVVATGGAQTHVTYGEISDIAEMRVEECQQVMQVLGREAKAAS
jgi:hypothetical protein